MNIPDVKYEPDSLLTDWEVIGPFSKPNILIERNHEINYEPIEIDGGIYSWRKFRTDPRGAVITGRVTEYEGENTVAYFRTFLEADRDENITIHFTTLDELTLYLNGMDLGRVYRDGYLFRNNDWNAWYDFWKNPEHAGRKVDIPLIKGKNQLIIKVRNGQFASGGFFARKEP